MSDNRFLDTSPVAQFDQVAEDYDDNLKVLLGRWGSSHEKFAEYKIQLLRCLIPQKISSILDFGCGTGRSLSYVKQYFPEVTSLTGCDVSSESLHIAAKALPEARLFLNYPIERLIAYPESWDMAFLACVLHHIEPEERKAWLAALAEHINPSGYLAVFEHNLKNPYTKKIVTSPDNRVDRIDYMLSIEEVERLILEAAPQFHVVWKGYTLFSPVRFPGVLSAERLLKWLPLGAQHCCLFQKG